MPPHSGGSGIISLMEEQEIEKGYEKEKTAAKLRRLAEALDQGKAFEIQVGGRRIYVPPSAEIVFEYETSEEEEELEIEIKWTRKRS